MIRLLGRHEWRDRSTARGLAVALSASSRSYSCRTFYLGTAPLLSTSRSTYQLRARQYSTREDTRPSSSSSSIDASILPSATDAKPRKIELHPAPKKVLTESSSTLSLSSSTSSSSPPAPSTSTSSPSPPSHVPSKTLASKPQESGILDQVSRDFADSVKAGILAPPPEGAGRIKRLYHQAKELFKFYAGGLKAQWKIHQMIGQIHQRIKEEKAAGNEQGMTRWETQLIRTHNRDLVKLVPFVLILLILEEALPLVVIYAPFMLPSTTILPSQAERIYSKQEEKKVEALVTTKFYLEASGIPNSQFSELGISGLDNDLAWTMCRAFSLSDRGPRSWVNRRLAKHLAYIQQDDSLLLREGSGERLNLDELRRALSERGQLTKGLTHHELRDNLTQWLNEARDEKEKIASFLTHAVVVGEQKAE